MPVIKEDINAEHYGKSLYDRVKEILIEFKDFVSIQNIVDAYKTKFEYVPKDKTEEKNLYIRIKNHCFYMVKIRKVEEKTSKTAKKTFKPAHYLFKIKVK